MAASNGNTAVYDVGGHFGPYTTWNPSYGASDELHPDQRGYAVEATWLTSLLAGQV